MSKIKLMDKDNNIIEFDHSIDAREALMSGNFFEISEIVTEVKRKEVEPKKKTVKVPEAEEKEVIKVPIPEVEESDVESEEK